MHALTLAVRDSVFDPFDVSDQAPGFLPAARLPSCVLSDLFPAQSLAFLPRSHLEGSTFYRQIIPYVILRTAGTVDAKYAVYRRVGNADARVRGPLSVGFGGHINAGDIEFLYQDLPKGPEDDPDVDTTVVTSLLDVDATVDGAAARELEEELAFFMEPNNTVFRGLIVSDATDVDRMHVGVVMLWTLENADQVARTMQEDSEVTPVEWLTLDELRTRAAELESWSQLVLDHLSPPADDV